jgi:hypothetical protein
MKAILCIIGNIEIVKYKGYTFEYNDMFGFTKCDDNGNLYSDYDPKFEKIAQEWLDNRRAE